MRELNKLTEYIGDKKFVISHKRVESIEEIPKLKFILSSVIGTLLRIILQEFQYGSNVLQTTTTDMNALNNPLREEDGCLRFIL